MKKTPEWNSAVENSVLERDWNIACKSEIFSNFAKLFINKQGVSSENEDEDEIDEGVDLPLKRNKDYGVKLDAQEEDYLKQLIAEAQAEIDDVEEIEESSVDTDMDGFIDDEFGLEPVEDTSDEYNTGAGDSKYIDIGLTDKTMNDIKSDGVLSSGEKSAVKEVMNVYKEEEVSEAEKDLGLDANAAYIFGRGKNNVW